MDFRPTMQDEAARKFFKYLEEEEFKTTFCENCQKAVFPPKLVCPDCLETSMRWVDLPRQGILYAFTFQDASFRCAFPDTLGMVELEGFGRILTRIDAPMEQLRIGMPVKLGFFTSADGLALHQFEIKS
jgi:uncharacterized OB-fold protein